jgi:CheY-like chemotaxis protein
VLFHVIASCAFGTCDLGEVEGVSEESVRESMASQWTQAIKGHPFATYTWEMEITPVSPSQPPTGKPRIVYVDDRLENLKVVEATAAQFKLDITTVQDGSQALSIIRRVRPGVVVLDLRMPNIDGWDIARALRADPELASVVIIILTSSGDVLDRKIGNRLGVANYLTKPFSPVDLVKAIEKATRTFA